MIRKRRWILLSIAGIACVYFLATQLSGWIAYRDARDIFGEIKIGMTEERVEKLAKSHGGTIQRLEDERLTLRTLGWSLICHFHIQMNNGVVVGSDEPSCIY